MNETISLADSAGPLLFSLHSPLFGLIGSLYYQTSSGAIRQLTERTTRNSIDQSSQFITSYLKKLKQTTTVLSKEQAVRQFAQDRSADQETVQHLMRTMIETDPDLVSAVLVTKDGRLVATDTKISMQTSSDMMNESWISKRAIKGKSHASFDASSKGILDFGKKKNGWFLLPKKWSIRLAKISE